MVGVGQAVYCLGNPLQIMRVVGYNGLQFICRFRYKDELITYEYPGSELERIDDVDELLLKGCKKDGLKRADYNLDNPTCIYN